MIYDAKVEVHCDGCQNEFVEIVLEYVYTDYSGKNGHYDDSKVIETLEDEHEWKADDDKHYCLECK